MKAMLLAAGRGEHIRPLTDHAPKPLLRVGGKPLISWHLQALARAGILDVVVNLSWLGEQLRAALGDGRDFGLNIRYSEEGSPPLETGGGIFTALPLLAAETLPAAADARLARATTPPQHARGDFVLDGELLQEGDGPTLTYSGIGLF